MSCVRPIRAIEGPEQVAGGLVSGSQVLESALVPDAACNYSKTKFMNYGVQERDVWEAAEAIAARGERPTVEKIRRELGRGSPNTINPKLTSWFMSLCRRPKVVEDQSAVVVDAPEPPPPERKPNELEIAVGTAVSSIAEAARRLAERTVRAELQELQHALEARERLADVRDAALNERETMLARLRAAIETTCTEKSILLVDLSQIPGSFSILDLSSPPTAQSQEGVHGSNGHRSGQERPGTP